MVAPSIVPARVTSDARKNAIYSLQQRLFGQPLPTLVPLLPHMLRLKGRSYCLDDHFPFEPLFTTRMPQQLVVKSGRQCSKTTSIAAQGVMQSNTIDYFSTLFVTPLFEQVRRFSANFVKPFIEDSPFKSLWMDSSTENSVLQRTFKNHSRMLFSFAFLDAGRIRGASADKLSVDESCKYGTMVATGRGPLPIEQVVPGDAVIANTDNGELYVDTVIKFSDHGIRDCYRLSFSDGSQIEITSDAYIATTAGWKRVQEIIRQVYARLVDAGPDTDAPRDNAGGREHGSAQDTARQPSLFEPTRLQAARVQLPQVHGFIRVREHTSQESEESGLRRMVQRLAHSELSGALAYRFLVLPAGAQARVPGVAGPADLGGDRLVVPGRREPDGLQRGSLPHPGLHQAGDRSAGELAEQPGTRSEIQTGEEPAQRQEALLVDLADRGIDLPFGGAHPTLYLPCHALQDRATTSHGYPDLSLVRGGFYASGHAIDLQENHDATLLRVRTLQTAPAPGAEPESAGQTGSAREKEFAPTGAVPLRYCSLAGTEPTVHQRLSPPQSGQSQSVQAACVAETSGSTAVAALDVPTLRQDRTPWRPGRAAEVLLAGLPPSRGSSPTAAQRFAEAELVGIEWTGQHRVGDLETLHRHAFTAGNVLISNCQDLDETLLPIIKETLSASTYKLVQLTGTPLSMENLLEKSWGNSSMGEFLIRCHHGGCGHWNIPAAEHDLLRMIGPLRDNISEQEPAVVCAKCRKPLRPRSGRWVHRYRDRRRYFMGLHIPQQILPMHYADPRAWRIMLDKQAGAGGMTEAMFMNEVCGESFDSGSRLITLSELREAATGIGENTLQNATSRRDMYVERLIAVDWGGGGEAGVSFTVAALIGLRPDGVIEVPYAVRSLTPYDHEGEARLVLHLMQAFQARALVHDYTGAGALRETFIVQSGVPLNRIMPVAYIRAALGSLLRYKPATENHPRDYYQVDKPRSLVLTCSQIKQGRIRFFQDDYLSDDRPGLLRDFLALVEEKASRRIGGDIYTIHCAPNKSDDFAQAVNIGCCALWHITQKWPNLAAVSRMSIAPELWGSLYGADTD